MPWESLTASDKVRPSLIVDAPYAKATQIHVLWRLCEWHLFEAERFRTRIGQNDEDALWVRPFSSALVLCSEQRQRDEPIGYDAQGNSFWYFYDSRLWIQRRRKPLVDKPKRPPRAAKPAPKSKAPSKSSKAKASTSSKKRKRPLTPPDEKEETRATSSRKAPAASAPNSAKRPRTGVRVSRRLVNGDEADTDGWQAVPEEWLKPSQKAKGKGKAVEVDDGALSDASSDLSSLSSSSESHAPSVRGRGRQVSVAASSSDEDEQDDALNPIPDDPNWIEWEVVRGVTHSTLALRLP